ncbi:MAG TPA: peptide ABC transporter substrate-binding protein [Gemmatimonadaceae bacterium]|nr:peptide ABC transporter substrate-binding protein [Gemmatimonadaceae bacterium]
MAAVRIRQLLLVVVLCACAGEEKQSSTTGGTLVISSGAEPDVLIPALVASVQGAQVTELIYDHLADIGDSLNILNDRGFKPRLSDLWVWSSDSMSIAFHINQKAKWHDGQPVQSNDVRFTYQTTRDSTLGSPNAALITNIDSVTTPNSATAVFWFHARSPQQFYDAVYSMPIMPEHVWKGTPPAAWRRSDLARHPIGSGQFKFVSWKPRSSVEVVADTANYHGAPKLSRVIWSIAPDPGTVFTRLTVGEADFLEALRPENLPELAKLPNVRTRSYGAMNYVYAAFNLRDPVNHARPHALFADRNLRRALTMAINREALVRSVYDSLAVPSIGPTVRAYPTTDPNLKQIPFDLAGANHLLDSLGWRDTDGDGIRQRGGRPLEFAMVVPGSSASRIKFGVLMQEQLRQAGVKLNVDQVEMPTMVERMRRRNFDFVVGAWQIQPSPSSVRGSWGTAGSRATSGNNSGSYESPVFDAYVDSALASFNADSRKAYFTKAYETIIQDAPAIWIAELRPIVAYHSRLELAPLRADAWWAHIADWSIPPDKRIPRDAIPTAVDSAAKKDTP